MQKETITGTVSVAKEAKRRSRDAVGQVPGGKVVPSKKRAPRANPRLKEYLAELEEEKS